MSNKHNRNRSDTNPLTWIFISVVIILLCVILAAVVLLDRQKVARSADDVAEALAQYEEQQEQAALEAEAEALAYAEYLEEIDTTYSVYQKLALGYDVDILVVGDGIGLGTGADTSDDGEAHAWYDLLTDYLQTTYMDGSEMEGTPGLTNLSLEGADAYAGYVRMMTLDDGVDYDLVILCLGEEDDSEDFALHYEALIRAAQEAYPASSVISILESSQIEQMASGTEMNTEDEYTDKMLSLQELCDYYSIPVADTVAAFMESGSAYDELVDEAVYPNDAGQELYFGTLQALIDENVEAQTEVPSELPDPYDENVAAYESFTYYAASDDAYMERTDEDTYTFSGSVSGTLGIDYTYISGGTVAYIYIDGTLYTTLDAEYDGTDEERHIEVVADDVTVEGEIQILFGSAEQAEGFNGLCISGE